jgi:hypothetical protein
LVSVLTKNKIPLDFEVIEELIEKILEITQQKKEYVN